VPILSFLSRLIDLIHLLLDITSNFWRFIRVFWAKISWRAQFVDSNKQLSTSGKQTPDAKHPCHAA